MLNIVDDVTRECLAAIPDTSIPGKRVARELSTLIRRRRTPGMILSDHGTEFTSNAILYLASDYNHQRPHSSLGCATLAQYAATLNAKSDRLRNPDQLRRSPIAQSAPLDLLAAETLMAAG